MLRYVRVLVLLVGADGVKPFDPENSDDGAKDVRLFDVNVDEFRRLFLDVLNRSFDVNWL